MFQCIHPLIPMPCCAHTSIQTHPNVLLPCIGRSSVVTMALKTGIVGLPNVGKVEPNGRTRTRDSGLDGRRGGGGGGGGGGGACLVTACANQRPHACTRGRIATLSPYMTRHMTPPPPPSTIAVHTLQRSGQERQGPGCKLPVLHYRAQRRHGGCPGSSPRHPWKDLQYPEDCEDNFP